MSKQEIAVFDIDGCLADGSWAESQTQETWNWNMFVVQAILMDTRDHVIDLLRQEVALGREIVIVTARPLSLLQKVTHTWLSDNVCGSGAGLAKGVTYYMMDKHWSDLQDEAKTKGKLDYVQTDFKKCILIRLKEKYDVKVAYDDKQCIVDMYRDEGVAGVHTP